ncbi:6306_t:CDS:2 [Acaulospora morrowiae]|uniref:6306_t:CDS:1 n=1 Tax=Acaulospora morrowiae TaxID=94023 RepID=A0A9N8Z5I7_9GLOM|nr:6306_t:CDS:2 [Acaulospora morrowiae]
MAVPQEPIVNGNESSTQVTSNKAAARTKQRNGTFPQPTQEEGYYLKMTVVSLDKSRRDPVFKIKVNTNLPRFKLNSYPQVERSYIEFERLYSALAYSNPECIVPALPFSITSYQSGDEDERRVKHAMQLWLSRVSKSPVLYHDEELRSFIETDFAFIPAIKPRKRSGSFRLKFSSDMKDNDLKLVQAKSIVHALEGHFLDTAKAAQRLARSRKGLSVYNIELGAKFLAMGTVESHPSLSNGLRKLGKVFQVIGKLQQSQAVSEASAMGDFFSYYAANAHVVKETLTNRLRIISEHDNAVKSTISKRRNIERLKSSTSIKSDKVDEALEDLDEAKYYEQTLDARAKRVTNNLHSELKIYEEYRTQDFLGAIKEYVKKQIAFEKQQLKELENLKPDIDAITKRNTKAHVFGDEELTPRAIAEKLSIMAG